MANELVVNLFTRRRFWKSVEQIQAKNISFESFFFPQRRTANFVRSYAPKIRVQTFAYFICKWKWRVRVNGAKSCYRPVVISSHATKSYRVNRPLNIPMFLLPQQQFSLFANGWVTSMSFVGTRMALDHSFTHSLTHPLTLLLTYSIPINLFINVGLNVFSPTSPAKYRFCLKTSQHVFDWFYGGTREV